MDIRILTNLREDFTITNKAPIRRDPSAGAFIYDNDNVKTLC